jgi:hydroxymethylpyrimidine pyrophosphatase-like HAD family hydrolase
MDLDGTLVGPDLIVSPRNRAAILAAQDRGAFVTLATGRMLRSTLAFARPCR